MRECWTKGFEIMVKAVKVCAIGGEACGTPRQLCGPDRVCPRHYKQMERRGRYDPLCAIGGADCGEGARLYGEDGRCREHHFYADPQPCIEVGCEQVPSVDYNKFVEGRCDTHYQAHQAAARRAGRQCSELWRGDCGPSERLYDDMCRLHFERVKIFGSPASPELVCSEAECEVTPETEPNRFYTSAGLCTMHYLRMRRGEVRRNELGERICPQCGGDMSYARRNSKYCGIRCTSAASRDRNIDAARFRSREYGARRKAQKLGNPGYLKFTLEEWLDLVDALDGLCTYCGGQFHPNDLEMDHIVPLVKGGPHRLSNITPACGACNSSKRDRPLLFEWAPKLLGGKPRWHKTAPRGSKGNPWNPVLWRDNAGPLPSILTQAVGIPELLRAIQLTELFFSQPDEESAA